MTTFRLWLKALFIFIVGGLLAIFFGVVTHSNICMLLAPLSILCAGIYIIYNKKKVVDINKESFLWPNSFLFSFVAPCMIVFGVCGTAWVLIEIIL